MNPSLDANLVEKVVRAVLAEMARRAAADRDMPAPSETRSDDRLIVPGGRVPVFVGRVLGERHVAAMEASDREIRLAPGTVITPLARDAIKRKGLTLRIVAPGELARSGHVGEWGIVIERGVGADESLRRAIHGGGETWLDVGDVAESAARWVASATHRGAAVLTSEASVACWRANQVRGVRAATVNDPDATARASRSLGVNCLIVEPAGLSISAVRHLLSVYRRAGAPTVPGALGGGGPDEDRRGDRAGDARSGASVAAAIQPGDRPPPARGGAHGRLVPTR
jgi:hypothetical protein